MFNGRDTGGRNNPMAVLTEEQLGAMDLLFAQGVSGRPAARQLGIAESTVRFYWRKYVASNHTKQN